MQGQKSTPYNSALFTQMMVGDSAATSVEGLRKLAQTYKSTVQGKLELDKFRMSTRPSKKPIDPRFRRTRAETVMTKSDTKVPSPFHVFNAMPRSLPVVSSMPSSPKRSPLKKNRCSGIRVRSHTAGEPPVEIGTHMEDTIQPDQTYNKGFSYANDSVSKHKLFRRGNSFIERGSKHDMNVFVNIDAGSSSKKTVEIVDKIIAENSCETPESRESNDKMKQQKESKPVNLATYIAPPINIKSQIVERVGRSMITIPMSLETKVEPSCVCTKCAKLLHKASLRSFDYNSSRAGTSTIIEALAYNDTKNKCHMPHSFIVMWCLYALGCLMGLILVSGLAWIMTNDMLWNWIAQPKESPPPNTLMGSLIRNCGAAVIFTANFVVTIVYKIIMLPRNSVFGSVEEETDSRW